MRGVCNLVMVSVVMMLRFPPGVFWVSTSVSMFRFMMMINAPVSPMVMMGTIDDGDKYE